MANENMLGPAFVQPQSPTAVAKIVADLDDLPVGEYEKMICVVVQAIKSADMFVVLMPPAHAPDSFRVDPPPTKNQVVAVSRNKS